MGIGCSVESETVTGAATDNETAPKQTQQENTNKNTDDEEEKKKKKKKDQEKAYREICVNNGLHLLWVAVEKTVDRNPPSLEHETERIGWHTVRIFVSSTFRDFHTERDVLVKKVQL